MAERHCPACITKLSSGRLGPIELDLCIQCGGVWFDCGELARVIAAGPQVLQRLCQRLPGGGAEPRTRPLEPPRCPGCRVPLSSADYASMPGIHLDTCAFCEGFWVGNRALHHLTSAVAAASAREQARPAAPPASAPNGSNGANGTNGTPRPSPPQTAPAAQTPAWYAVPQNSPTAQPPAGASGWIAPPPTPPRQPAAPATAAPRLQAAPPAPTAGPAAPPPAAHVPPPWQTPPVQQARPAAPAATNGQHAPRGTAPATARRPGGTAYQAAACPHCGESNGERAAVCWACAKPLQGPVACSCPHCSANMRRLECQGVDVDACEGCGGVCVTLKRLNTLILKEKDDVDRLLVQVNRFRPDRAGVVKPAVDCPHCTERMFLAPLGMLTQQEVPHCGHCFTLFLEQGILDDIVLGQRR